MALLVQFCFFGAYFVMSLPCGWIVGKIGYKTSIVVALSIMGLGLLLFLPASIIISYALFLFALFVVGSGLALLQVAINPYVGALGPPETAASRLNLCGFLNSLATTFAPRIGAFFIFIGAAATTVELARSVRMPYVILAAGAFLMAGITALVHLPRLIETNTGSSKVEGSAWKVSHLRLGAVAIFCYVGAEVAIGSIMINFLGQPSMGAMSHSEAAHYVSYYWGSAMVGRLIGFFALQKIQGRKRARVCGRHGLAVRRNGHRRSRSTGRLDDRRLRSFQLHHVALYLPALGEEPGAADQPRLGNPGHHGSGRRHHSGDSGLSGRHIRLPTQLHRGAALLRLHPVLRHQRL